ncbi:MAG: diaminopimelate decarboxylase, partial [Bacteroidales bacterium]|nr:diaminopimelate decarboxylase [Bacteroidales bacterium]
GFPASKIVFAGVGKADWEINLALDSGIACFNVESIPELEVINHLAAAKDKTARVAIRVNPNVDPHTHKYITTGLEENKFGIPVEMLLEVLDLALTLRNIRIIGLHFHIGSQLLDLEPFSVLCDRINDLQNMVEARGIRLETINVGGGLGCDYDDPDANPIPDFASFFSNYAKHLKLRPGQELHFELGRSVVCQCGSLITRALYVKEGLKKKFVILDAGMSELIRPALYQAHHKIQNLSAAADSATDVYDVVGPICESSDVFGVDEKLPVTQRGDIFALRSAGAYGQIMSSNYNCRRTPASVVL